MKRLGFEEGSLLPKQDQTQANESAATNGAKETEVKEKEKGKGKDSDGKGKSKEKPDRAGSFTTSKPAAGTADHGRAK